MNIYTWDQVRTFVKDLQNYYLLYTYVAQSAGKAAEYTDCFNAEG